MRKLASIQAVNSVFSIDGADRIEGIQILGWKLVAKKDEFKIGDLCIFYEIDSLMEDTPCYEFLRTKKLRVKTYRCLGQISQGLALPITVVGQSYPQLLEYLSTVPKEDLIGTDVTSLVGVVKWQPSFNETGIMINGVKVRSQMLRDFPSFIPKTDEPRIQSYPRILEYMTNKPLYISAKQDGQSFTSFYRNEELGVCSRNQQKKENEFCQFWCSSKS